MGKVKSTAYFSSEAKKCFEGESERDMGDCCSDELEVIQLDNEQLSGSHIQLNDLLPDFIIPAYKLTPFTFKQDPVKDEAGLAYDLPPPDPVPVYLLLSSFIFYG